MLQLGCKNELTAKSQQPRAVFLRRADFLDQEGGFRIGGGGLQHAFFGGRDGQQAGDGDQVQDGAVLPFEFDDEILFSQCAPISLPRVCGMNEHHT